MHIPILIETLNGSGFRDRIVERMSAGTDYATLEIPGYGLLPDRQPPDRHPIDDEIWEQWRQAVADYRRQVDEDDDIP